LTDRGPIGGRTPTTREVVVVENVLVELDSFFSMGLIGAEF
jgi:hypothetical protein